MSNTELVEQCWTDAPVCACRKSPAVAALGALWLSRIGRVCIVQIVDGRIPLPAPAQKRLEILRDVMVTANGELVIIAGRWIIEAKASGIETIAHICIVGRR